MMIMIMMCC